MTREEVHAALMANAARRAELRPAVLAAIRENRPRPAEADDMGRVLADDERLQ
jgi:hypothetical protein